MLYRVSAVTVLVSLLTVVDSVSLAQVVVYQNDEPGWLLAAGPAHLLDFDSIPGSTTVPIVGDEFIGLVGSPIISAAPLSETPDVFVGDPTPQVDAPSLPNMLYPTCDPSCEGIVTISFAQPVSAISALFLDVESDFATTGFSIAPNSPVPTYSFTGPQGQASVAFFGIVSAQPFTSVDIHFSTGQNIDGVLVDDVRYALQAPEWEFIRGDSNSDQSVDLSDSVTTLQFLFGSSTSLCVSALDANDDGAVNIADAVYALAYLFNGGPSPPPPFPDCGPDLTPDPLSCLGPLAQCPQLP